MANVKSEGFSVMTALDAFVVGWQAFHLRFSLFQEGGASKGSFLPGRGTLHEGHRGPSVILATVVVSTEPQSLRKHSAEDSRETNEWA